MQALYQRLYCASVQGIRSHMLQRTQQDRAWLPALGATLTHRGSGQAAGPPGVPPPPTGTCEQPPECTHAQDDGSPAGSEASNLRHGSSMEHLSCFAAGMLALGAMQGVRSAAGAAEADLKLAQELVGTCYEMYRQTPTGECFRRSQHVPEGGGVMGGWVGFAAGVGDTSTQVMRRECFCHGSPSAAHLPSMHS